MITAIKPGMFTTVQDGGRWGYQAYGMPVAGAMDRYAYGSANLLVGNSCDAAALEMTMLGGTFRFDVSTSIAICGADMGALLNGMEIRPWQAVQIAKGSELVFSYALSGCRAYLAVQGGIDVPLVMGSRSTYTRASVGGFQGRALRPGDVLSIGEQQGLQGMARSLPTQFVPRYETEISLRVLLGPQNDLFTAEGVATLFNSSYVISSEADRMGYRLEGPKIQHLGKADIVSDALCQGAVQVPAHGMPIVMMADRATTGGYTKIGTVIGPDLTKLAQAKPGDTVRFMTCTDADAVEALRSEREIYRQMHQMFNADKEKKGFDGQGRHFDITVDGRKFSVKIKER